MVMWKMVLSVRCLVVSLCVLTSCNIVKQQDNKTTRQQNNKSVCKTVPFSIRKKKQQIKIR